MRERTGAIHLLCVFCQNVNRNYAYMDTLLASLVDEYDVLMIQEPPWWLIRQAPSSRSREGDNVVGAPSSPSWSVIVRHSDVDSPPRVLAYINKPLVLPL
jgi:hypothetical protein